MADACARFAELLSRGLSPPERRVYLASRGRLSLGELDGSLSRALELLVLENPARFLDDLAGDPVWTEYAWHALARMGGLPEALVGRGYPGRSIALHELAGCAGLALPDAVYALPEHGLEALLDRAEALRGSKVPLSGSPNHKGRVGDGVERLLVGRRVTGKQSDHRAAEIKSVPVRGDVVVERVKLGVVSRGSNPLTKCDRVLFVFVEKRGEDHFIRGHRCVEFDGDRWRAMWSAGYLVETAAGSPRHKTRGLYLIPGWFRSQGLWPPAR